MTHGNKTILTRAVVLGLGLSSVLGGLALAGTSGNTTIYRPGDALAIPTYAIRDDKQNVSSMEGSHNTLQAYDRQDNAVIFGVYLGLENTQPGTITLEGNSMTVGTEKEAQAKWGSLVGVAAAPKFQPADGKTILGQVMAKDNLLTVENAQAVQVIGVDDLTDNRNSRDFSSFTAENNKLQVGNSIVGGITSILVEVPNSNSKIIVSGTQTIVTDTTVNGYFFDTYQRKGLSDSLTRTGNTSIIKNSTINGHLFGSNIYETNNFVSQNNVVSLSGSTVAGYLVQDSDYGTKAEMTGNELTLDNSKAYSPVVGEWFNATVSNASATAQNNNITLSNKSYAGSAATVFLNGTQASSEASANTLTITGNSSVLFGTPVEGGATASSNQVTLEDSQAGILTGAAVDGDANGNAVTLSGDSVVDYDKTKQTLSGQGITSPETGLAFAGLSSLAGNSLVIGALSMSGQASHNAINVTGNVDLTNAELYGALNSSLSKPTGTGNTLRIGYDGTKAALWTRNRVKAIGAFDKVELWQGSWGTPMLRITEDSDLTDTTVDVSHLTFTDGAPAKPDSETVLVDDDVTEYEAGKNVTVDDGNGGKGLTFGYTLGNNAASLTGSFTGKAGTKNGNVVLSTGNVDVDTVKFGQVTWGTTPLTLDPDVTYDFKDSKINTGSIAFTGLDGLSAGTNTMTLLDTNGRAINLSDGNLSGETLPYTVGTTLEGQGKAYLADGNVQYDIDLHDNTVKPQAQTHMTVIGQQAGLTSVLEGSDLVLRDLLTVKDKENGPFTFASVLGGENRYETGSSLRTNGWNGHAGFGWKKEFGTKGVGETALFYDYGDGNYRTYDGGLYGHGDLRYRGAGLLGRFTTPDKVFVEGSVRTGRVDNKARHVLVDGAGNGYDYDTDSRYTAFHVGAGRTVALNHRDSLEWYGRYFYTHVNGDDFEAGGRYHLDSVDSSLVRLGARWQRNSGKDAWYAGAAYEYEFDGDATGTADGRSIRSASLQGSSARLEAGMLWNRDNWTIQTGVHGYMGKHRGIGGTVDFVVHL